MKWFDPSAFKQLEPSSSANFANPANRSGCSILAVHGVSRISGISKPLKVVSFGGAAILPPSSPGSDHLPANELPGECRTPLGDPVTGRANDETHADQIRTCHPDPHVELGSDGLAERKEASNPGIPSDLYVLAARYCVDAYGDGPDQLLFMAEDLKAVPDEWHWWRLYFMEKLGIPEEVRCIECGAFQDTGGGLGRCSKKLLAPGAGGLWWIQSLHPCAEYSERSGG